MALRDASFSLREGRTLAVVGESGSGKSSLAYALLRLVQARGRVALNGRDLSSLTPAAFRPLRREIQIVFQDPGLPITAYDNRANCRRGIGFARAAVIFCGTKKARCRSFGGLRSFA